MLLRSFILFVLWMVAVPGPLAGQRTEVGRTLTEALAPYVGFGASGFALADVRVGDDSTDVGARAFLAVDPLDGDVRGGVQAIGYFELPSSPARSGVEDLFGEARVIALTAAAEEGLDHGILVNTAAHLDYGGWGLAGSIEVGALWRDDVRSFSTGVQGVFWQQVGSLVGTFSYRVVRFPLRIPDPSFFQADGRVYYHDLGMELHRDGPTEVGLRLGHRFNVPGGTWAILEVTRPVTEHLAVAIAGGRSPGAPELSAIWGEFVSLGLKWRANFGGWDPGS